MASRRSGSPFFHLERPSTSRGGVTRIDIRKWSLIVLGLVLFGLVGWLYLEQASRVAGYGYTIRQLENRKERLRREITALRAEVAVSGSLTRVHQAGEELGYALPDATDPGRRLVVEYAPIQRGDLAGAGGGPLSPDGSIEQSGGVVPTAKGLVGDLREWLGLGDAESD